MDLSFTPDEEAFAPRSARGSPANVEVPPRFETIADEVEFGRRWQAQLAGRPLGRHPLARGVRRAGRVAGAGRDLQHGVRTLARAAADQPGRHQPRGPDAARARHRRAEGNAGCRRSSPPSEIWCQLFSEPDAGLRPRVAARRAPCASTTAGCSRARRCGRRTRSSRAGASASPAPTPTCAEAQGHLVSRRRHAGARHRGAAARADHRRRRVQRGVLRRGVRARRPSRRRVAQRLGGGEHDARARAGHRVPVQGTGRARGVPRRAVAARGASASCSTTSRSPTRSRSRSSSCACCGCTTGARSRG